MTDTKTIRSMLDAIDGVYEVDKTAFTLKDDTWQKTRRTFHVYDCITNYGKCRVYVITDDFSKNPSATNSFKNGMSFIRFSDVPLDQYYELANSVNSNSPTSCWCGNINMYATKDGKHVIRISRNGVRRILGTKVNTMEDIILVDFVIADTEDDGFEVIVYDKPETGNLQQDKKLARVFNQGVKSFGDFFEDDDL